MNYIKDAIELVAIVFTTLVGLMAIAFLFVALAALTIGPQSCAAYGEAMSLRTEFEFWNGCFVEMADGRVLPEDVANDVLRQEYRVKLEK